MRTIFVGSAGLRAGWGLAIFATVAVAIASLAGFAVKAVLRIALHGQGLHGGPAVDMPIGETLLILGAVVATAVMARIERRSFGSYGLSDPARLRHFAAGLAWGIALLSLETGILAATGHATIVYSGQNVATALGFALLWGYVFVLAGFAEEMLFRGYPLAALTRGIGFWPAAILISVAFGAVHGTNGGEAAVGEVSAGLVSLAWCFAIARTGSLWWPIGFHAAWDWAESALWGAHNSGTVVPGALFVSTPVGAPLLSGGAVGPEGSLFVLIPILLVVVVIAATTRGREQRTRGAAAFQPS